MCKQKFIFKALDAWHQCEAYSSVCNHILLELENAIESMPIGN